MHQLPRCTRHLIEPPGQLLAFWLAGDGKAAIAVFVGIGFIGFQAFDHLFRINFKLMGHELEKGQFFICIHRLITIENSMGHGHARDLANTAQERTGQIGGAAPLSLFRQEFLIAAFKKRRDQLAEETHRAGPRRGLRGPETSPPRFGKLWAARAAGSVRTFKIIAFPYVSCHAELWQP